MASIAPVARAVGTLPVTHSGRFTIDLPGRQYMAVRLRAVTPPD